MADLTSSPVLRSLAAILIALLPALCCCVGQAHAAGVEVHDCHDIPAEPADCEAADCETFERSDAEATPPTLPTALPPAATAWPVDLVARPAARSPAALAAKPPPVTLRSLEVMLTT